MRDMLPAEPLKKECAIVNLDSFGQPGTHWVCFIKDNNSVFYFDSYGYYPPSELEEYLNNCKIYYNTSKIQNYDDPPICGYLCIEVLRRYSCGENFNQIIVDMINNKYLWTSWFS